jgi:peptidyl-prolyl cis-trans isomerase B (cyclophilin B)
MARTATFETTKGTIVARLDEDDAPITTANFIELAQKGFYDGLTFHRYAPGFVIQGGDPNGTGTGGSGKHIKLEVAPHLKHDEAGVLAMARSQDPNSASSQFYFTLAAAPHLDMGYAVFGRTISGIDVVKALRVGDRMTKVTINES